MALLPYLVTVLLLAGFFLIRAEFRNDRQQIYVLKPIATLTVILVVLLSFWHEPNSTFYSTMILLGLIFSMVGDMALMFPDNLKAFRAGLASFLLAHVVYAITFFMIGTPASSDILPVMLLIVLSGSFYKLISDGLGQMKGPVIAYILIISTMVAAAITVQGTVGLSPTIEVLLLAGALLFYVSDLILAANRFWKPWRYNRISLAFYYSGQLLIALSVYYFTG